MPFRTDRAVETLRAVVEVLAAQWAGLDAPTRGQIEALVRQYGPLIAAEQSVMVALKVKELLSALWDLRAALPAPAVQALQAAHSDVEDSFPLSTSGADKEALRRSLVRLADFRAYASPALLQQQVAQLVARNAGRLTVAECANWQALEADYRQDRDPAAYLRGIESLLGDYPAVAACLEQGKTWVRRDLREGIVSTAEANSMAVGSEAAIPKGLEAVTPALVDRYGNIYFPAQVLSAQKRIPLVVHIAQQYVEAVSNVAARRDAQLSLSVGDVTISLRAEGFTLDQSLGGQPVAGAPAARIVRVEADRDCEPVLFFLTPQSAGCKRIAVDVYQFERNIATLSFEAEVIDQGGLSRADNAKYAPVVITSAATGQDAVPPDLELRVMLGGDGKTLLYTLHSPRSSDYNYKPAGQVTLSDAPKQYFQSYFDRLSTLARRMGNERTAAETRAAERELLNTGANLYRALFSKELKAEYARFRNKYRGKSLMITSDDPWIPWEIIHPVDADDDGNVLFDDPPLCETFRISRWLAGRGAPDRVTMKNGIWVAPPDNLEAVQIESDYFATLHRRQWLICLEGPLSTVPEVEERFEEGDTELFHFSCHGNINTDDPDESKLRLAAGEFLRPSQIIGQASAGLRRSKPVVFLNACHGGRVAAGGATQLGGWAQRFLDSGASIFIGAQWEIRDELAAQFALAFYNRLWGLGEFAGKSMPLGQAFYEARMEIKAADSANSTWLAYVLYGDPLGQMFLGEAPG